ncbi:cache domain-containing sensor histidine kinase [Pseudothauera rhizosphaerae]|nr:cache domain-containing protein [Pseudothauera rhizosphaerae]
MTESTGAKPRFTCRSTAGAVIMLAAVLVLALIAGAAALMADLAQQERQRARDHIASLSRILVEQTTRTFGVVALNMRNTRDRLSDSFGQHLRLDDYRVQLLLQARTQGLPQVKSMFVVSHDGRVLNSSRPDFPLHLDVNERGFFRHFVEHSDDGVFIGPPERARVDGQWTYYAAMRLTDTEGHFRGVLATAMSIDHFESFYQRIAVEFAGYIQLLRDDGHLLAEQPSSEDAIGRQAVAVPVLARLHGTPADMVVEAEEDTATGRRFVAYRNVADFPLSVAVAIDEDAALSTWRGLAEPMVVGVGFGVLFIVLSTWLMVRALMRRDALERALKESDERLRYKLAVDLENVREEERARISREMHDELGQLLTGIRMEVSWLGKRLSSREGELACKADAVKMQIDQVIATVRRISAELRPLVLDDLGFAAAASWYVDQFSSRTGLAATLDLPAHEAPRGSPVASALFRILQESLTNAARHAGASRVSVRLSHAEGKWRLAVQDDGCGFDPAHARKGGIGLVGMRERAAMLGGRLSVASTPGGGTLVEAIIPEYGDNDMEAPLAQNLGIAGR